VNDDAGFDHSEWSSDEIGENAKSDSVALGQQLTRALTATAGDACVIVDDYVREPQAAIDRDTRLVDDGRLSSRPVLRIWRNARCIVASRSQAGWSLYRDATCVSAEAGWPVVTRRSGGTAVTHGSQILNISRLEKFSLGRQRPSPVDCYLKLLELLIGSMSKLGVQCDYGVVADACCDGKYNLRWQGRKLAGTAGFISRRGDAAIAAFHASIRLTGPCIDELNALERFETMLGRHRRYRRTAYVSLAEILSSVRQSVN
jgi:octanoyl-[GcvH]:protein N-octanoyltransferase